MLSLLFSTAIASSSELLVTPLDATPTLVAQNTSYCYDIDPLEEWPFPPDCLQQIWLDDCTDRGSGYPADVSNLTNLYNSLVDAEGTTFGTWGNYTDYVDNLGTLSADATSNPEAYEVCRGSTDTPTQSPTITPTTAVPSPAPTYIPTALTRAPTYANDPAWKVFYPPEDGSVADTSAELVTKAGLKELCDATYNRQHDLTNYIWRVRVKRDEDTGIEGNWTTWDYWRPPVQSGTTTYHEFCDALVFRSGEPGAYTQLWPMRCKNTNDPCYVTDSDFWDQTIPMDDGRSIPHLWVDQWADVDADPGTNAGAYSTNDLESTPTWGHMFEIEVTSTRVFPDCTRRLTPWEPVDVSDPTFAWTTDPGEGRLVENPCFDGATNALTPMAKWEIMHPYGSSLNYNPTTKLVSCDEGQDNTGGGDNDVFVDDWALWYAVKNQAFMHCDIECIWDIRPLKDNQFYPNFWQWTPNGPPGAGTTSAGCWKYGVEEGHPDYNTNLNKFLNDPTGGDCRASTNMANDAIAGRWDYKTAYDYWVAQMDSMCTEECDYTNDWHLNEEFSTCIKKLPTIETQIGGSIVSQFMTQVEAQTECEDVQNGTLVSINSWNLNTAARELCHRDITNNDATGAVRECWVGAPDAKGTAGALWPDGTPVSYMKFETTEYDAGGDDPAKTALYIDENGYMIYSDPNEVSPSEKEGICQTPANMDQDVRLETYANQCRDSEPPNFRTNNPVTPYVKIADCGFTDPLNPNMLHIVVVVPRRMYDMKITFENSTNDAGEWDLLRRTHADIQWTYTETGTDDCNGTYTIESAIPWQEFNLGGAGGVSRLENYMTPSGLPDDTYTTIDPAVLNQLNKWYIFASTIRVEGKFPIWTQEDYDDIVTGEDVFSERFDVTDVIIRTPLIIKFQKSVVVESEFEIISTKFNYKTVAAIIESIQLDTRYDAPPYARFELKIRTKSQYPYMFDECANANATNPANNGLPDIAYDGQQMYECTDWHNTFPEPTETERGPITNLKPIDTQVSMQLYFVASDIGCTFINPDHSREGDVCTQEWRLRLMPERNKCYATGDYHIRYDTKCFHGKEVCYMPKDEDGNYINSVWFTFKLQTSKFCPQVVDEVQLTGFLQCTGRESYKPTEENAALIAAASSIRVEANTPGSAYLQGEVVKFIGSVDSPKARITNTRVRMVEVTQDLTTLLQTGVNRVPYDDTQGHMVIWTRPTVNSLGETEQIATGTFSLVYNPGNVRVDDIFVMGGEAENYVKSSGDLINADHSDHALVFAPTECGFQMLLHSKAFPINRQSFGVKTVIVTMEVDYQALDVVLNSGRRRRRMLQATSDVQPGVDELTAMEPVRVEAFRAQQLSVCNDVVCGLRLVMTMSDAALENPAMFASNVEFTFRRAIEAEIHPAQEIEKSQIQVTVMEMYDKTTDLATRFWSAEGFVDVVKRPKSQMRRLPSIPNQEAFVIYVLFKDVHGYPSAAKLREEFVDQVSRPASALMQSEIILNSLFHSVESHDPQNDIMKDIDIMNKYYDGDKDKDNAGGRIHPALPTALAILGCLCALFGINW